MNTPTPAAPTAQHTPFDHWWLTSSAAGAIDDKHRHPCEVAFHAGVTAALAGLPDPATALTEARKALADAEQGLVALATSELNIDVDGNRAPHRLAIRNDVWKRINRIRAALARLQPEAGR